MGGGDLNLKKSWHPLTYENQERIWKEEQKAAEEKKKLEQLRKELEEERQIQELQRLKEQAGHGKRQERVDWMYASGPGHQAVLSEDREAYLLGKRRADEFILSRERKSSAMEGFLSSYVGNANTIRDTQSKIREDPLFYIKKKEQETIENVLNNPIKMKELTKEEKDIPESKRDRAREVSRSISPDAKRMDRASDRHWQRSPRRERYHRHDNRRRYSPERRGRDSSRRDNHKRSSSQEEREKELEKKKRLEEMIQSASDLDAQRKQRHTRREKDEREKELSDKKQRDHTHRDSYGQTEYMKQINRDAYSGEIGLSERIQRNRGVYIRNGD